MIITAYLGVAGLSDVGYQFFTSAEASSGSRITAGIVDAGSGWYSADATIPSNSISVRWNSAANATIVAREYYRCMGDPLVMDVPDSYPAGSAGKLLADNLDAKVSTRSTQTSVDTVDDFLDTEIVAIKTKTDNLPSAAPGSVGGLLIAGSNAPVTMNITGNLIGDVTGSVLGNVNGSVDHVVDPTTIAFAVRDVSNASPASGSLGEDVKDAAAGGGGGSGADPWLTLLPGAYGAGTAGKILGDRLDVLVSSRLADADFIPAPTASENATATRDIDNTSPPAGSLGDKINNAASAGDPWGTSLPGAYAPGTAGKLIGTYVDTTISSRLGFTDYVIPPTTIQISEAVRDVDNTAPAVNSLGAMVKANADVGDPWVVALPGAYGAGSAGKIVGDNLNATVSSRSTYAGTDTPGTTTLLTRVPTPITVTGGKVDVNDKTGFSLTSEYDDAKTAAQEGDEMTLAPSEYVTLAAEIWNKLTSTLTLAGSIGKWIVDKLDATVNSRLASASYVAPDNAGIAAIKGKTDNLPASPASVSDIPTASQNAVATRDVNNTNPASQSLGADVKTGATSGDPWTVNLPGSYGSGTAGNILGVRLDVAVSSRMDADAIVLDSGEVTVGTNNDKTGYSLSDASEIEIADAILKRDFQAVSGEPTYCVLNALRFLRSKWEVKPDGTLIVYKENGDVAWSRIVLADAEALPIVGVQ